MHTKRASSSLSKSPAVFTTPLGAAVLWTRPFPFHAPTPKGRAGWEEENPVKDINNLVNKGPLLNGILPFLSLPPFVGQLPPSSSSPIEACRPGDRDLGAGREEEGEIAEREEEWGGKGRQNDGGCRSTKQGKRGRAPYLWQAGRRKKENRKRVRYKGQGPKNWEIPSGAVKKKLPPTHPVFDIFFLGHKSLFPLYSFSFQADFIAVQGAAAATAAATAMVTSEEQVTTTTATGSSSSPAANSIEQQQQQQQQQRSLEERLEVQESPEHHLRREEVLPASDPNAVVPVPKSSCRNCCQRRRRPPSASVSIQVGREFTCRKKGPT